MQKAGWEPCETKPQCSFVTSTGQQVSQILAVLRAITLLEPMMVVETKGPQILQGAGHVYAADLREA